MLVAFVKRRRPFSVTKSTGNVRFYNPKGNKADHIVECCQVASLTKWTRHFVLLPLEPIEPLRPVLESGNEDMGGDVGGISVVEHVALDENGGS